MTGDELNEIIQALDILAEHKIMGTLHIEKILLSRLSQKGRTTNGIGWWLGTVPQDKTKKYLGQVFFYRGIFALVENDNTEKELLKEHRVHNPESCLI